MFHSHRGFLFSVLACAVVALSGTLVQAQTVVAARVTDNASNAQALIEDATFTVTVTVLHNSATVGSYALRLEFDPTSLSAAMPVDLAGGELGTPAASESPAGTLTVTAGDAGSTFTSGDLFSVVFTVLAGATDGEITVDASGLTPLVGTDFQNIPHTYDSDLFEALPGTPTGVDGWREME